MTDTAKTVEPSQLDRLSKRASQSDLLNRSGIPGADSADPEHQAVETDNGSLALLVAFVAVALAVGFLRTWWIPGFIGALLVVLFMHELGHYLTARASGMKVTEFFVGFGPKIWSFNKGETEYGFKALPAGAYVRIMGMTNLDEIDPTEEHRTYRSQPYWQRMMTICAGSAMHFLMAAIALFVLFFSFGYNGFNGPPWVVNQVVDGSTASSLGIESGDQILSVNGDGFDNWDEFGEVVSSLEEGPVEIVIDRRGEVLRLNGELGLRPEDVLLDGFGLRLLQEEPDSGYEAAFIWPNDKADEFGIERGDVVLSAGGVDLPNQTTLAAMLRGREGDEIAIEVERAGESVTLTGVVELNTSTPFRGFFGVGPEFVPEEDFGFVGSVTNAATDFGAIAKANLSGLVDLVNPVNWFSDEEVIQRRAALSFQGVDVPLPPQESQDTNRPISVIGVGRLVSNSDGVDQVFFMFVMINIFVGIFNLVPVLPLDGGHAAVASYERARELVTRKPHRVDAAKLIPVTWLVIVGLVGLGLWTTTLDVFAWPS